MLTITYSSFYIIINQFSPGKEVDWTVKYILTYLSCVKRIYLEDLFK